MKSSCFERQTPLEVDFRAFWVPSGGILRHQSILAWASGSLFLFGFQRNLFFYCKVNQKSINPGLGLWIAIFFWIRVEKSIRNQSIQAWASGSFCLFGFEGKVNQKPINPGLGLWISRGQRRKVAGPATLSHHGLGEQRGSHCTFAPLHGGDAYIHKGHGHIYMYI